ncbi:MAG: hypothetical protein ACE15C_15135 [Phycisphaerae bacterium]
MFRPARLALIVSAVLLAAVIVSPGQDGPPSDPNARPGVAPPPAATEPATTEPAVPPVVTQETMFKSIPADTMGFLIVKNGRALATRIEKFVKGLMPPILAVQMGQMNLLENVTAGANLGETFDPNGAFAVVVLDPVKYGAFKKRAEKPAPKPEAKEGEEGVEAPDVPSQPDTPALEEFPLALLVPGKDAMKMFANHSPSKDGKFVKLAGNGQEPPWWCRDMDVFVVVTPNKRVLDAFSDVKPVTTRFGAQDKDIVARNDLAVWLDMAKLRKFLKSPDGKMIERAMKESTPLGYMLPMAMMSSPLGAGGYVGFTRSEVFDAADTFCFGMEFARTGIMAQLRANYAADTPFAKALAAYKPSDKPLTSRLPDLPYIFAYGATRDFKMPDEMYAAQLDKMLAGTSLDKVPAELKAKAKKAAIAIRKEVTAVQHYIGPSSADDSAGVACLTVAECKSPDNVRKAAKELVEAVSDALKDVRIGDSKDSGDSDDENNPLAKLKLFYTEAFDKVGDYAVDAVKVQHPALAEMDEADRTKMKAILGEDKVRLLIGQADKNTLIITLGGGMGFMKLAIESAGKKNKLEQDAVTARTLTMLPKERAIVALVNISNAWNKGMNMAASMGAIGSVAPVKATPQAPMAGTVSFDKGGWTFSLYMPSEGLKEVVKCVMNMTTQGMWGGGEEAPMPVPQPQPEEEMNED